METKKAIIAAGIFAVVTVFFYVVINSLSSLHEGVNVVIALLGGFLAEILYRKI